mgnify:CR=1 FL=1
MQDESYYPLGLLVGVQQRTGQIKTLVRRTRRNKGYAAHGVPIPLDEP